MSEQLKHIFDSSACLSKRQLKDYVTGAMSREESHALEHHVNSCFFCSEALDGMQEHTGALVTVEQLNTGFLKDHFSLTNPQIHLNSLAPAAPAPPAQRRVRSRSRTQPMLLKPTSIAAAIILGFGVMWYLEFGRDQIRPGQSGALATSTDRVAKVSKNEQVDEVLSSAQSTAEETSSQSRVSGGYDGGNQSNDNPQKVQPLLITDTKANSANESTGLAQKDITTPPISSNKSEGMKQLGPSAAVAPSISKVEKIPERKPQDIRSLSVAGATGEEEGSLSNIHKKAANEDTEVTTEMLEHRSDEGDSRKLSTANALYEAGNYGAAATSYKEQMSDDDKRTSQQATLMAARSYLKLGQKEKARQLLQTLVKEGTGSQKRQAKRLLKDIEE